MRELAGGKPAGFKLCVGLRHEFLAICKAMVEEGTAPDFIIVDGSEGGTGAAPAEYEDHVGMPLTEGLMTVHNALVGCRPARPVKIGASGKIATGSDIVKRLAQGADYTNAARAMMQADRAASSLSAATPTSARSASPPRTPSAPARLTSPDKTERVHRYQHATVHEAQRIIASMGLAGPG